jgi:hypothetical protein
MKLKEKIKLFDEEILDLTQIIPNEITDSSGKETNKK